MQEFRRLALEGVADKLERPSGDKQSESVEPQTVDENAGYKDRNRQENSRNTERVTEAVHRIPVIGAVLRDPLLVSASAQHAEDDITEEDERII